MASSTQLLTGGNPWAFDESVYLIRAKFSVLSAPVPFRELVPTQECCFAKAPSI